MKIKSCGEGDCENGLLIARLVTALRPFADFADPRKTIRAAHEITQGSRLAKRQLTMGDCYLAAQLINEIADGV